MHSSLTSVVMVQMRLENQGGTRTSQSVVVLSQYSNDRLRLTSLRLQYLNPLSQYVFHWEKCHLELTCCSLNLIGSKRIISSANARLSSFCFLVNVGALPPLPRPRPLIVAPPLPLVTFCFVSVRIKLNSDSCVLNVVSFPPPPIDRSCSSSEESMGSSA